MINKEHLKKEDLRKKLTEGNKNFSKKLEEIRNSKMKYELVGATEEKKKQLEIFKKIIIHRLDLWNIHIRYFKDDKDVIIIEHLLKDCITIIDETSKTNEKEEEMDIIKRLMLYIKTFIDRVDRIEKEENANKIKIIDMLTYFVDDLVK
jgi:hypothetical protein